MRSNTPLTEGIVQKVIKTVACGLIKGLGEPIPGRMCVEAAVCYAYGIPHSDSPPCVGEAIRAYKIEINDAPWSSSEARAKGMLAVAVAQLGSVELDQREFARRIVLKTVNTIIADLAIVYAPYLVQKIRQVNALTKAGALCLELSRTINLPSFSPFGTRTAYIAEEATSAVIRAAYNAAYNIANAAAVAGAAADAATAVTAVIRAAANDAYSADKGLLIAASNCLEVLVEMESPGCKFLYLLEK